jgi:hypothetical protein
LGFRTWDLFFGSCDLYFEIYSLELVICFARRSFSAGGRFGIYSLELVIWDLFFGACDLYFEIYSLELGI